MAANVTNMDFWTESGPSVHLQLITHTLFDLVEQVLLSSSLPETVKTPLLVIKEHARLFRLEVEERNSKFGEKYLCVVDSERRASASS